MVANARPLRPGAQGSRAAGRVRRRDASARCVALVRGSRFSERRRVTEWHSEQEATCAYAERASNG